MRNTKGSCCNEVLKKLFIRKAEVWGGLYLFFVNDYHCWHYLNNETWSHNGHVVKM